MANKIHIIGGGTFSHVRNHLALAAPAFGSTARKLYERIGTAVYDDLEGFINKSTQRDAPGETFSRTIGTEVDERVVLHLTKMADSSSNLVTNDDVSALLDTLIADPDTRVIILNAALCDYDGSIQSQNFNDYVDASLAHRRGEGPDPHIPSGSHAPRLKTADGNHSLILTPAPKLIGKIRKERKDIFVVGFKTTTGETSDEQYRIALNMLKRDSLNLVLANDTVTRNNMIVTPEESRYSETTDREAVLSMLVDMVLSRSSNSFTRSTVIPGEPVAWDSKLIPDNLRAVVDYCIERGAYKPFRGATVGHFAVKLDDTRILTSKRKRNFNELSKEGLVLVEYEGDDKVIAHGAKPSVGGQSQRIIFEEHPGLDCIVHFHSPLREDAPNLNKIAIDANQWKRECGSHECGRSVSEKLPKVGAIRVVMIDNHGPNIVFSRDTPANDIIEFIETNFDLEKKTGGMVA